MTHPQPIEFSGSEGNRLIGEAWDGGSAAVLFLHGGGQTRYAWMRTAERVAAAGMRAVAVDMRGHGDSAWSGEGNYTFHAYADDAGAILDQMRKDAPSSLSVVGASLGGLAAMGAELRRPGLIDRLVLVDVVPRMSIDGVAKIQGFMGERMDEGFATLEEAAEAIARYLPNRKRPASLSGLRKNLRLDGDGRFRWHWDPAFLKSAANINTNAENLMLQMIDDLPKLSVPTLLVRGMQSELVDEASAQEFVSRAPNARFVDVGGAGHMVAGDRNDVFARAVLQFLTDKQAA